MRRGLLVGSVWLAAIGGAFTVAYVGRPYSDITRQGFALVAIASFVLAALCALAAFAGGRRR